MTGPEHYAEAERLLDEFGQEVEVDADDMAFVVAVVRGGTARAQVHATLALAAATALPAHDGDWTAWREVAS